MAQPSLERRSRIESLLRERLAAEHVEVIDESGSHVGHAGAAGGAGHFQVLVVSSRFEARNLVERQRLVYAALAEMLGAEIHALAMRTLTPEQWKTGRAGA